MSAAGPRAEDDAKGSSGRAHTPGKNPGERTGSSRRLTAAKPYIQARAEGIAAGRVGRPLDECPYSLTTQEDLTRLWIAGHRQGRDDRRTTGTPLPAERSTGTRRAS